MDNTANGTGRYGSFDVNLSMGQGMMMKDMMQMMMDMDKMMSQMDKMMSDMRLMMMKKCMETSGWESKKEEQKNESPGKEAAPEGRQHKH